jgi:homoserine kinase
VELIKANLRDDIIEPARKHLIPGFEVVQYAALRANAWGASIAGAGPSIFAWCDDKDAKNVMNAMLEASIKHGHKNSRGWFGKINTVGAKLI